MRLFDFFKKSKGKQSVSIPRQMLLRFLANGQVAWFPDDNGNLLNEGFLNNHAIFTIQDWLSQKVASAPPLIYEVKDEKSYKLHKSLLKNPTNESLLRARDIKHKALTEVSGSDMEKVLNRPNNMMGWYEFAYGYSVFKNMCGSSYFGATRDGMSSPIQGAIKEMDLFPSHDMTIVSGTIVDPIKEYFLKSNPEVKIPVENVLQIRNFSPRYDNQTQWMYGLSKLYPLRSILQEYNEATSSQVKLFQDKGIRDIIFPKGSTDPFELTGEQAQMAEDILNRKLNESGQGGIIGNNIELGNIRVGFSPVELGILESRKLTKSDFCAAYHIPDIIFGWSEQTTYNNLSESRKIALTDAVLPELEQLKDGLNNWLVPSYESVKQPLNNQKQKLVIDFDLEYFNELQEDKAKMVEWMSKSPLTANEWRRALRYDDNIGENTDDVLIPSGLKLLKDMGIGSFEPGGFEQDLSSESEGN